MAERRRATRRVVVILGGIVVLGGSVAAVKYGLPWVNRGRQGITAPVTALHEKSPMADLRESLRNGNPQALVLLSQRLTSQAGTPPAALSDQEADEWVATLGGLRTGF